MVVTAFSALQIEVLTGAAAGYYIRMNVYDFDGTIYEGDSTADFFRFSLRRHPGCLLTLPLTAVKGAGYALKIVDRDGLKTSLYRFLRHIPDIDEELELFWDLHEKNLMSWYLERKREDDLIISASPQFLLEPVCRRLGVRLIASPVDKLSGELLGPNNHGDRKTKRLREQFPEAVIDEFYSDSRIDAPLAGLAGKAFLAVHGVISPWDDL